MTTKQPPAQKQRGFMKKYDDCIRKYYFNVISERYVCVQPCYCGGFIWTELLDKPRKKTEIINCYSFRPHTRIGWVYLDGIILE